MGGRKVPLEVVSWGVLALISTLIVTTYGICEFPARWRGIWFLASVPSPILINGTFISTKGFCLSNKKDKYLMEDKAENCYRCMVIYDKHRNVLQYKETMCEKFDTLENICNNLAGDATLYSLFRSDATAMPVSCPLRGLPFSFVYNRGNGECNYPTSMVDSCAEDSTLIFRYQACPDVQGSESSVEVVTCMASWKDGFTRYFVAKVYFLKTNETSFRCFVYERVQLAERKMIYNLAQSGDATCNGLLSAIDGSNVMTLSSMEVTGTKCRYPSWISDHHHWHTLDGTHSFHFSRRDGTLRVSEDTHRYGRHLPYRPFAHPHAFERFEPSTKVVCHSQVKINSTALIAIAHITKGCESGYTCLGFLRREVSIIEILQSRTVVINPEEACVSGFFNPALLSYLTLISSGPRRKPCPYPGKYHVIGEKGSLQILPRNQRSLPTLYRQKRFEYDEPPGDSNCSTGVFGQINIGCSLTGETMELINSCKFQRNSMFFCYGNWVQDNIRYLVTSPVSRKSTEAKFYCWMWLPSVKNFKDVDSSGKNKTALKELTIMVSATVKNCYRTIYPGISGLKTFNLTVLEHCERSGYGPNSAVQNHVVPALLFLLSVPTAIFGAR